MNGIRIFSLAGIPVHFTPFYLLLLAYYAWSIGDVGKAIAFIIAVTISLLVHEFGHAMVARHYKLAPQVFLHGFGGLCAHERAKRDLHDVLIIIAGPGVGILFALLMAGLNLILNFTVPDLFAQRPLLGVFFEYVWFISFFWNFVNLIPLWPLDGGQLFRLGAVKFLGPVRGEKVTHYLGAGLCVICAFLALQYLGGYLAIMICLLLAWENIRQLRSGSASGAIRRTNKFANELYAKALEAQKAGDWREAARLGHQIRSEGNISDNLLDKIWMLLAISTAQMGEHKEALGYIKRAQRTPAITEAHIHCLIALKEYDKAIEMLELPEGKKLSAAVQQQFRTRIEESKPL